MSKLFVVRFQVERPEKSVFYLYLNRNFRKRLE